VIECKKNCHQFATRQLKMVAKVTELEPITKRKNRIESNISADHKTPQNGNIQTTNPEVAGSNPAGRAI